ncbi:HAD hydrolase-like protein [Candidatus Woesearchaeota archaeon]|nr:HAD hydrolase-like protein [Candidatus Woesearchaeota archaeon]MBW3006105.1 HAD hydrolase-like protein [Candidatus Woesearchaeota archaeon]
MGVKKIIGFDFDGSVIRSIASDEAHYEWFKVMSVLLKDPKVKKLAGKRDYFPDVYRLMKKYTGLSTKNAFEKEVSTRLARNLYQLAMLGPANKYKKKLLFKDVAKLILKLKKKYKVALITTVPGDIVLPMLKLINFEKFDIVHTTPINEKPSKLIALKRFSKKYKKPALYIGNTLEDMEACKKLKIKSVLVTWGKYDKKAVNVADYVAQNAEELKKIIKHLNL